jgi:hypothetical protein
MSRFSIDFFEFSFLVEACIPPRPIARAMFWDDVIDKHYNTLTDNERGRLFEWINRNPCMQDGIEEGNEDCLLFNARFNPENQYKVHTNYNDKLEVYDAFKLNDRYYIKKNTSIEDRFITKVEKSTL